MTGIHDKDELTRHIETIQKQALGVSRYPCILKYRWLDFRTGTLPAYHYAMAKKAEADALWIDVGCFCGTDVRKAIHDGWPGDKILGTDLEARFVAMGRQLFCEREDTVQPCFLVGDLFNDAFLAPKVSQSSNQGFPQLASLKTLTPLTGKATVISAGSLFHLFDEKEQQELARRLLNLLSSTPGSIILGGELGVASFIWLASIQLTGHAGRTQANEGTEPSRYRQGPDGLPASRRLYSTNTWVQLWKDIDPTLDVEADLSEIEPDWIRLSFSVKRA